MSIRPEICSRNTIIATVKPPIAGTGIAQRCKMLMCLCIKVPSKKENSESMTVSTAPRCNCSMYDDAMKCLLTLDTKDYDGAMVHIGFT